MDIRGLEKSLVSRPRLGARPFAGPAGPQAGRSQGGSGEGSAPRPFVAPSTREQPSSRPDPLQTAFESQRQPDPASLLLAESETTVGDAVSLTPRGVPPYESVPEWPVAPESPSVSGYPSVPDQQSTDESSGPHGNPSAAGHRDELGFEPVSHVPSFDSPASTAEFGEATNTALEPEDGGRRGEVSPSNDVTPPAGAEEVRYRGSESTHEGDLTTAVAPTFSSDASRIGQAPAATGIDSTYPQEQPVTEYDDAPVAGEPPTLHDLGLELPLQESPSTAGDIGGAHGIDTPVVVQDAGAASAGHDDLAPSVGKDVPPADWDEDLERVRAALDDEFARFSTAAEQSVRAAPPLPEIAADAPNDTSAAPSQPDSGDARGAHSAGAFAASLSGDVGDAAQALREALARATEAAEGLEVADVLEGVARRIRNGEIVVAGRAGTRSEAATLAAVLASLLGDRA